MVDEKIIELFFARSEQAISELDKKYGKVFQKTSYNILNEPLDVEECVNDAYLGTWNTIPPTRPHSLLAYVCQIVRNISLKRYHLKKALKRNSTYDLAMEECEQMLKFAKQSSGRETAETYLKYILEQLKQMKQLPRKSAEGIDVTKMLPKNYPERKI